MSQEATKLKNFQFWVFVKLKRADAQGWFSRPVNPETDGAPDYFNVVKTPMDFGTIEVVCVAASLSLAPSSL